MGKKNKKSSAPRPGSVAARRAAGTNKAAQNQAAKASSSSRSSSSSSSNRSQAASRAGSVAANRAAGTNKSAVNQAAKAGTSSNFTNAQMAGRGSGGGLVAARRAAQQESGLSMKDYRAGVSGGTLTKHGKAINGSSNQSNAQAGSVSGANNYYTNDDNSYTNTGDRLADAWGNLRAEWDQDAYNAQFKGQYIGGKEIKGITLGENGFYGDANNPIGLGFDLKKYGFRAGDQIFDTSKWGVHDENKDIAGLNMAAETSGRLKGFKKDGTPMIEMTGSDANPNWDKYEYGKERMSSEGLYQDRYNVGYHGADDKGDTYASEGAFGSINNHFSAAIRGETTWDQAYDSFVNGDRKGHYAGDVLKYIDNTGTAKVSDDFYNRVVVDAQNYDWDKRGEIAGRDSGDAYYDSRTGGRAGNQTDEAKQEYMKSIGHPAAGGFQNDYDQGTSNEYQQNQYQQQNNMNYDFSQFMPTMKGSSKFKAFKFDPFKFLQGQ